MKQEKSYVTYIIFGVRAFRKLKKFISHENLKEIITEQK